MRYDGSFVMVAAHQGNYGQLMFRGCALEEVGDWRTPVVRLVPGGLNGLP